MNITIIEHKENGYIIHQRIQDGYINATAMCKADNRLFADYKRLNVTKDFLDELSRSMGIPIDLLINKITTGNNELRGTWIHPQVAINLGQWLSPKFAVKVSKWISDWMNSKTSRLPNFSNPYEAALAWAEEYKEKQLVIEERDNAIKTADELGFIWFS